jgi:hypothetical protein
MISMTFPDATAINGAADAVTTAYNAFPILGAILAIVLIFKVGPKVVQMVKRAV